MTAEAGQHNNGFGVLYNYVTGALIGPATKQQHDASLAAGDPCFAKMRDFSLITVDGVGCYVEDAQAAREREARAADEEGHDPMTEPTQGASPKEAR